MVDLLDEIRDDLKDEKVFHIIKKYSSLILTLMATVIIGVALKMWWAGYKENQIHKEGSEFMIALKKMQANDVDNAVKEFETLSNSGSSNYSALARLLLSAHYLSSNDAGKASAVYEELAKSNHGKIFKDTAFISNIKLILNTPQADMGQVISRLEGYIKKDGIFKYSAEELLAISQVAKKELKEAQQTIERIENAENVPSTIKLRAEQLSKTIN